jgi:glycosyltransferase involved in cell wall biosynthesis
MHVLQVIPALEIGGAETMVVGLSNALVQDGHSVVILTECGFIGERYSEAIDPEVNLMQCWKNSEKKLQVLLSLPIWMYRNKKFLNQFDAIHCHLTFGFLFGVLYKLTTIFSGKNYSNLVFTNHSIGGNNPYINKFLISLGYPFFSSYVCVAESSVTRNLQKVLQLQNLKTIFNGITVESNSRTLQTKKSNTIGTLSRLTADRDPKKFIEIFCEVQKRKKHLIFKYVIGGRGPLMDELKEFAHHLGLLEEIVFIDEVKNPSEFLGTMDLYITRTVENMTGIAGLEAIGCGTPVIGLQSLRAFVVPQNAWIWSSNDPKKVAAKIIEYFDKPIQLEKLRILQHDVLVTKFNREIMVKEYLFEYAKPL